MIKRKSLEAIIKDNKLCIKDNPYGSMRLWPNSYIELFYEDFCKKLYERKNSPEILELNQLNKIDLKIWELFFDNPKIDNYENENLLKEEYKNLSIYDMIIIKNNYLIIDEKISSKLISILDLDGIIICENIGRQMKNIIKIFFKYIFKLRIDIYDYRLNSFVRTNCLLIIRKNKNFNIFLFFKSWFLFLKYLIFEFIISLLSIISKR